MLFLLSNTLNPLEKWKYFGFSTPSKAEVMMMIPFHDSGYRCLKHFYLEQGCKKKL